MSRKTDLCVSQQGATLRATIAGVQELKDNDGLISECDLTRRISCEVESHIHLPVQVMGVHQQGNIHLLVDGSALFT